MGTEIVRFEKAHAQLQAGLVSMRERASAIDLKAEGVEFDLQKMAAQAQEALRIAKEKRDKEAAPLKQPLEEIRDRWKPIISGFDELFSLLKVKASMVLVARQKSGQEVRGFKTESGTLTSVKVWRWEVEDLSQVPDTYLVVSANTAAIDAAVNSGTRAIPGVKIWEDVQMVSRGKKR